MSFLKKLFGSNEKSNKVNRPSDKIETSNTGTGNGLPEPYDQINGLTDIRRENLLICLNAGFKPSRSLPMDFDRQIRPAIEIANRLNAIKALVLWLMVPEDGLASERILNFVENNNLKDFMTADEKPILELARDDKQARNSIGWKFENAWPLAWFFGYDTPKIDGQMMTGEQMQDILMNYSCPLEKTTEEWIQNIEPITTDELKKKEDLFYCLHNAVRSAQLGGQTVPNGFDPIGNGGVIHERRHSLTWMLQNGVAWEDTDLST